VAGCYGPAVPPFLPHQGCGGVPRTTVSEHPIPFVVVFQPCCSVEALGPQGCQWPCTLAHVDRCSRRSGAIGVCCPRDYQLLQRRVGSPVSAQGCRSGRGPAGTGGLGSLLAHTLCLTCCVLLLHVCLVCVVASVGVLGFVLDERREPTCPSFEGYTYSRPERSSELPWSWRRRQELAIGE